jgi:flagellar hook-associated protein 1 FlgK
MLGLFGTLNLGARSLGAEQLGSEVTGQNLANVNNPAYARQRVQLVTSTPVSSMIGPEGSGVDAVAIVQLRNYLLDQQITSESGTTGSLNAQQAALQYLQSSLGEQIDANSTNAASTNAANAASSQNGLAESLSDFFSALQSLSANPSSLAQRQAVVQAAQALTTQFNQIDARLGTIKTSLNDSIQSDTTNANQLLSDIAKLNQQIVYSEAGGGTANDLRDLRQQKLEQLSQLANVTTTETPNGALDVSIGGVTMVTGINVTDQMEAYDAGGGQIMVRAQTAGTPLTLTGGSIEGSISVRDGALATLQGDLNNLAGQLITQVNTIHAAGFDLNGGTGLNFFGGTDAATIGVTSAIVADPSKIQASGTAGATGDNSVALALAQLANTSNAALNNQTFSQSYATTVANVGSSLASVNGQISNHSAVMTMLSNQRDSTSGVSLDEEMTNLMQFQKAFQASAQLITTVNQMLETVVSMKTV